MNIKSLFAVVLLLPILTACNYNDMLAKLAPKEESAFAKNYLESVRIKDFNAVKKSLKPELVTSDVDAKITEVANYFPLGDPIEIKQIGAQTYQSGDQLQATLTYQYQFPKDWAVGTVILSKSKNVVVVEGFNVTRLSKSLQETNAFNLANKTPIHYLFLTLAVLIPIFVLTVLILCIRTTIPKKKWLWVLFVLVGFVGFTLNWTTGELNYQVLSFHFFGAGAVSAGPYSPWFITISLPIGAVVFLLKRKAIPQVINNG